MAKRNVLHISKLEDLKKWMIKDGWELLQPVKLEDRIR